MGGEKTSTGEGQGVCLTNGEVLPGDLTVVTEGSLYIEGDYNKYDHAGNTLFDTDGDVVGSPVASNVSAVIADAVEPAVQRLDEHQAPERVAPVASETTFNVSVYTGNQPTEGSAYNGGFENLPRFHEKWTGIHCYINGSFVQAWQSEIADGTWSYGGDRYKAPRRDWVYDTRCWGASPVRALHRQRARGLTF